MVNMAGLRQEAEGAVEEDRAPLFLVAAVGVVVSMRQQQHRMKRRSSRPLLQLQQQLRRL